MIKCEVIENFTLEKFGQLKNVKKVMNRKNNEFGVRDTFECDKEMVDYLTGNNPLNKVVVKVIEVEPEKIQFKKDMEFLANAEINGVNCLEATCNAIQKASEKIKTTKKKKTSKK